jgi:hypothetical protein
MITMMMRIVPSDMAHSLSGAEIVRSAAGEKHIAAVGSSEGT